MKQLIVLAFVLFCTSSFSQQPFEGTIRYRLHATSEKDDAELVVHFGTNRIRVEFIEPRHTEGKDYFLVALDSGKVYSFDIRNKTYRERWLSIRNANVSLPPSKTIAGHSTTAALLNNLPIASLFRSWGLENAVLYTADNLYFPVPEKYGLAAEVMMVQNNEIVLGSDFTVADFNRYESGDSTRQKHFVVSVEATSITAKKFTEGELSIPTDFHEQTANDYASDSTAMSDTATTVTTTTKAPSKPKNKKGGAKPAMQKEQAVRRKKQ